MELESIGLRGHEASCVHVTRYWKTGQKAPNAVTPITQQVAEQHQLRRLLDSVTHVNKSPKFSNGGRGSNYPPTLST